MKTLVIIFFGLITHVNQPWSLDNTAVLPNIPGHAAEMRIPKNAVIAPGAWLEPFVQGDEYVVPLRGVRVRVRNTRDMFLDVTDEFRNAVPRLKALAPDCKLSQNVRNRRTNDGLAAFIDYRAGRIEPESYFGEKLEIPNTEWADGRCAVCKVRYTARLRGDEAVLEFTMAPGEVHVVRIKGNEMLKVNNVVGQNEPPPGSHFDHSFAIFESCFRPLAQGGGKCTQRPICNAVTDDVLPPPFPGVDCTNSAYP